MSHAAVASLNGFMAPTRFPPGVTNMHKDNQVFKKFGLPFDYIWHVKATDFDDKIDSASWTTTMSGAGAAAAADGDGGRFTLTTGALIGDTANFKSAKKVFTFDSTKQLLFATVIQVDSATLSTLNLGFTDGSTNNVIQLVKAAGGSSFAFVCTKAAASVSQNVSSALAMPLSTDIALAFGYTGTFYSAVAAVPGSAPSGTAPFFEFVVGWNYLPSTDTGTTTATFPGWQFQSFLVSGDNLPANNTNLQVNVDYNNSSAAARVLNFDWLIAAKNRVGL